MIYNIKLCMHSHGVSTTVDVIRLATNRKTRRMQRRWQQQQQMLHWLFRGKRDNRATMSWERAAEKSGVTDEPWVSGWHHGYDWAMVLGQTVRRTPCYRVPGHTNGRGCGARADRRIPWSGHWLAHVCRVPSKWRRQQQTDFEQWGDCRWAPRAPSWIFSVELCQHW